MVWADHIIDLNKKDIFVIQKGTNNNYQLNQVMNINWCQCFVQERLILIIMGLYRVGGLNFLTTFENGSCNALKAVIRKVGTFTGLSQVDWLFDVLFVELFNVIFNELFGELFNVMFNELFGELFNVMFNELFSELFNVLLLWCFIGCHGDCGCIGACRGRHVVGS